MTPLDDLHRRETLSSAEPAAPQTRLPRTDFAPRLALRVGVVGQRRLPAGSHDAVRAQVARVLADVREEVEWVRARADVLRVPAHSRLWCALRGHAPHTERADRRPAFRAAPTELRLISPLAEGADQLAAEAALGLPAAGAPFRLRVPVPFAEDDYLADFDDLPGVPARESRERYRALVQDARSDAVVLELDGDAARAAGRADVAHLAVASFVLAQSDVLVAIASREHLSAPGEPASACGTRATVQRAVEAGLPVVWIEVDGTRACVRGIARPSEEGLAWDAWESEGVRAALCQALAPDPRSALGHPGDADASAAAADALRRIDDFYREPRQWPLRALRWLSSWSHTWRLFERVLEAPPKRRGETWRAHLARFARHAWREVRGRARRTEVPDPAWGRLTGPLSEVRDDVEHLAGALMSCHRSAFALAWLLGACAVLLGVTSYFARTEGVRLAASCGELLMLGGILLLYAGDNLGRRWRERAIDYRALADELRHGAVVAAVGGRTPVVRTTAHRLLGPGAHGWMSWYARAVAREADAPFAAARAGLPRRLRFAPEGAPAHATGNSGTEEVPAGVLRTGVARWWEGQVAYHRGAHLRYHRMHAWSGWLVLSLFAVVLVATVVHLAHLLSPDHDSGSTQWLVYGCVALPAFLAALHGVRGHGELERLAERSHWMGVLLPQAAADEHAAEARSPLWRLVPDLAPVPDLVPSRREARRAERLAHVMVEELLDWRVLYLGHETEVS